MIKYLDSKKINNLKKVKLWANTKAPQKVRPLFNYALGWVCPELLGHGVVIKQLSDQLMAAQIPYEPLNLDSFAEIQQGLVVNVAREMVFQFLEAYLNGISFVIDRQSLEFNKTMLWKSHLQLEMADNLKHIEKQINLFIQDQEHKVSFVIYLKTDNSKKTETLQIDLQLKKQFLLD